MDQGGQDHHVRFTAGGHFLPGHRRFLLIPRQNVHVNENIPHIDRAEPGAVMMASCPEKKQIPRLHGKGFVVLGDGLLAAENI